MNFTESGCFTEVSLLPWQFQLKLKHFIYGISYDYIVFLLVQTKEKLIEKCQL